MSDFRADIPDESHALQATIEDLLRYWRERCLTAESSLRDRREQGDPVLVENERLAREDTQCHEQNNRLVSEHYDLKARIADFEDIEKVGNQIRAELYCEVAYLRVALEAIRAEPFHNENGQPDLGDYVNAVRVLAFNALKHILPVENDEHLI